jgi:hypothetical protein
MTRNFVVQWAEKCGIGFELFPLAEPNVPKNEPNRESAKVA